MISKTSNAQQCFCDLKLASRPWRLSTGKCSFFLAYKGESDWSTPYDAGNVTVFLNLLMVYCLCLFLYTFLHLLLGRRWWSQLVVVMVVVTVMKVMMVWHLVSDSCKVMMAPIVVLASKLLLWRILCLFFIDMPKP
jgi:hypothetical protein